MTARRGGSRLGDLETLTDFVTRATKNAPPLGPQQRAKFAQLTKCARAHAGDLARTEDELDDLEGFERQQLRGEQ